jgi:hypothetical protein
MAYIGGGHDDDWPREDGNDAFHGVALDPELLARLPARGLLRRPPGAGSWTLDAPDPPDDATLPDLSLLLPMPDAPSVRGPLHSRPLSAPTAPPLSVAALRKVYDAPALIRFLRWALTQGGWLLARLRW